jgi:hypothetical protein
MNVLKTKGHTITDLFLAFTGTVSLAALGTMLLVASIIAGLSGTDAARQAGRLAGMAIFMLLFAAPAMAVIEHAWQQERKQH